MVRAEDLRERMWEDVEENRAFITKLLDENGIAVGAADPELLQRTMVAEAGAHTWVQVRDASGTWVSLDPSFAGGASGEFSPR